jgi:hypothetical protein
VLLAQHGGHLDELLPSEAGLPTKIGAVVTLLGMLDAGSLCRPGGLSLRLGCVAAMKVIGASSTGPATSERCGREKHAVSHHGIRS